MKQAQTANAPKRSPPALDPESPGLIQPWKDFCAKGWISELTLKKTPFGWNTTCQVPSHVSEEAAGKDIALGAAKQLIITAGLWSPKGPKAKSDNQQALPKKSLVPEDFLDKSKLAERAKAVALALTDTVARGRIGSLKLMHEGVDTFDKWWSGALPPMKTRIFMDEKHHKKLTDADHLLFASVVTQCPFRGSVPTPSGDEEEGGASAAPAAKPQGRTGTPPKPNGNSKA